MSLSTNINNMLNKKLLTDIFLRKDTNEKRQRPPPPPAQEIQRIDQSYIDCKMSWDPQGLALIRINAYVAKGQQKGDNVPLTCKWYAKSKYDFREIEGVKASYYQPCLDDVGCTLSIHLEPFFQDKIYEGVTIIKEVGPIKLPLKLQKQCQDLLNQHRIMFSGKIQTIFSQNVQFQNVQTPVDVKIILENRKILINEQQSLKQLCCYEVSDQYPQVEFIRKSFNTILVNWNDLQSFRVSFSDNNKRDLFGLLVRTLTADETLQKQNNTQNSTSQEDLSSIKRKQQGPGSSMLVLKVDQLTKQNQQIRRQYQQIKKNYHLERQAKIKLSEQLNQLKKKYQQINEQASKAALAQQQLQKIQSEYRFMKNVHQYIIQEVSMLKMQKKNAKQEIQSYELANKQLKEKLNAVQKEKDKQFQQLSLIKQYEQQLISIRQQLENQQAEHQIQLDRRDGIIESQQDQIIKLKKKNLSLVQEKQIISPIKSEPMRNEKRDNYIETLEIKVKSLEMLLKYKANQKGSDLFNMQHIINSLTQSISEKQTQLDSIKKINKELLKKISQLSQMQ